MKADTLSDGAEEDHVPLPSTLSSSGVYPAPSMGGLSQRVTARGFRGCPVKAKVALILRAAGSQEDSTTGGKSPSRMPRKKAAPAATERSKTPSCTQFGTSRNAVVPSSCGTKFGICVLNGPTTMSLAPQTKSFGNLSLSMNCAGSMMCRSLRNSGVPSLTRTPSYAPGILSGWVCSVSALSGRASSGGGSTGAEAGSPAVKLKLR
mmetsp:Transcript_112066/g.327786  ORF Transcript_112066/g.327786 Transcript_112066/m.327786 type:complete len:206 (+) Transcript_112066:167-784(+)